MASRFALSLLAAAVAAVLGCTSPPAPASLSDEALFAAARSCDPASADCARLRSEATGRATRAEAERAPKTTYSFAPQ